MLRSLIHFRRVNLAVMLAAAVAAAVLTGALLVGDSVRGSLRDLALQRLGEIELALTAPRFFRESLADDLGAVPAIQLPAGAVHAESGKRAARISLHGIDERFTGMFAVTPGEGAGPAETAGLLAAAGPGISSVVLNESLARELGAGTGDAILISFPWADDVPRDTVLGRRGPTDLVGRNRLVVGGIISDDGLGRFGLSPHQGAPLNAFIDLAGLQRLLRRTGEVNSLFLPRGGSTAVDSPPAEQPLRRMRERLRQSLQAEDLGLKLSSSDGVLTVESREFVLRPHLAEALEEAAGRLGLPVRSIQTYLANEMVLGERTLPYSTVTSLDTAPREEPFRPLLLVDGSPAPALGKGEILPNTWAAEQLAAGVDDEIEMAYYVVGPREELSTRRSRFRVRGIVAMDGLGADRTLTPEYPGIHDADDIAAWDPPFPVDLGAVGPRDEEYWDRFRATPKAFVSAEDGRELWSTRYGRLTSLRVAIGGEAHSEEEFRQALQRIVDPEPAGFRFIAIREEGLSGASGATDFSGLFLGFSFFLILSATLLVGLLFSLGVEQRAGEVGLLLAVGYPVARVRRQLIGEGAVLAAGGALAGVAAGILYAGALMAALRTVWRPAVGSSSLFLHVQPLSLGMGWLISILVVLVAVWFSVRRLSRLPAPVLLSGSVRLAGAGKRRRITPALAWGGLAAALLLAATAVITGATSSPGLSFGTGAALLVSGLAFFALWCRDPGRGGLRAPGGSALAGMAARNSAWNPGRSILSLALVASASFVIVTVASNRQEHPAAVADRESGTGGFALVAESSVPLHHDLNSPRARFELGFGEETEDLLSGVTVYPFRLLPGSDASCLNLYRPEKPRILGVPPELVERGGFTFQSRTGDEGRAWDLLDDEIEQGVVPAFADAGSAQWILHLGLGQDVVLEDEFGQEVRLRLVGLLGKGIFQSEILVSEENLLKHFPSRSGYSYFLVETPGDDVEPVAEAFEAGLARFGFDTTSTVRKLADFQVVENTYLSTFQALGGLGLLLGTVGLGIVLLRNVLERRRELATLRAFGYRRRRLAAMVLAENAFLLVMGLLIGSLSAILAVAPRLLAGEVRLPWISLAGTLVAVLVVGMLSSLAAVLGALRVPLLPVLKADR